MALRVETVEDTRFKNGSATCTAAKRKDSEHVRRPLVCGRDVHNIVEKEDDEVDDSFLASVGIPNSTDIERRGKKIPGDS
ncbi:Hypothetical protein NTJ_07070 [Nesidiocoris tenuis]|uniref:Uncharacterized protein n=1 Tax=Nesidiocoris tenuis TaxID=355587 RepID=A0ABN7ATP5_9HEMI|nr:Hypothetical protein NTJ_07070 [Nesidiocoris tenuis]